MDNQSRDNQLQYNAIIANAIIADIVRLETERERDDQDNSDTEGSLTEDSDDENSNSYTRQQAPLMDLSTNTIPSPRDQNPPEPEENEEQQNNQQQQLADRQVVLDPTQGMFLPVNRRLTYPAPRHSTDSPTSPIPAPRQENDDKDPQQNATNEQQTQRVTTTHTTESLQQHNTTSTPRLPQAISIRRTPARRTPTLPPIHRQSSAPRIMTMAMAKKRKIIDLTCEPHPASSTDRHWNDISSCQVCYELPRLGPIYTCSQGHLICQRCNDLVKICPLCRDPILKNRSRISEYIIGKYLKDNYTACLNHTLGCNKKATLKELYDHEVVCPFTEVTCPGKIHGCEWKGARISLPIHINTTMSCVDKIESVDRWMNCNKRRSERYINVIRDFGLQEQTIFLKTQDVFWKPILHSSNKTNPMWTYLVVSRKKNGVWTFQVKGYMSPELALQMRAKITLTAADSHTPNNGMTKHIICPMYTGAITSHWTSDKDAENMGRYLTATDLTIAQLRHPTIVTKLFNYTVEIEHTEEIEEILRKENAGLAPQKPKPIWSPLQNLGHYV
jgi:hypothetical protein